METTCLIRDYLGVKNYSGKVEVRVKNYFHLDVVSLHPNQQILGHWELSFRYTPVFAFIHVFLVHRIYSNIYIYVQVSIANTYQLPPKIAQ